MIAKLVNVNVSSNNVEVELLLVHGKGEMLDKVNFVNEANNEKIKGDIKRTTSLREENENITVSKVIFELSKDYIGQVFLEAIINKEEQKLVLVDNRGEGNPIAEDNNRYVIFTKTRAIEITGHGIIFSKRGMLTKIKYEISKQRYSIKKYKKLAWYRLIKSKPKYYLFNDRMEYADDNAFALFEYINKYNKKIAKKCYFVLDKDSKDRGKVKKIGNVVINQSKKHKRKYINCKLVISSHSSYIYNCFNAFDEDEMTVYKDLINKKFMFLQHGVIMNDVSNYLNREYIIADRFVVSTKGEEKELKSDKYMYEDKQVVGTGLPRFDKLHNEKEKMIFISPTWRKSIVQGKKQIKDTEYFKEYKYILTNKDLKKELKNKGYKIVFLLHPMFSRYKEEFFRLKSENIEIVTAEQINYATLFNKCSMLITDYSSIHYDVAYQYKPVMYYQYDQKVFFGTQYHEGYFNYGKDGFGKVVFEKNELLNEIIKNINNDCKTDEEYNKKIKDTFIHIDKQCCERVVNEIKKMEDEQGINYRFNNVH